MTYTESIYNNFSSIIPAEMSNRELRSMAACLYIAKTQGREFATVMLPHGVYNNPITRLKDYQAAFKTECGSFNY